MIKSVRDFDVKGKRVLVRCDFNVPVDGKGNIADGFRIEQTLPTIKLLASKGAKVILLSHLDNPKGEIVEYLRFTKIQELLASFLSFPVFKAQDCVGREIEEFVSRMRDGEVLLLENVRFHAEEQHGDAHFAKQLADLGEIFINDAFSVCHRNHASVAGIPRFLPSFAGLLLEKEVSTLEKFSQNPPRPFVIVVGGKKVGDKLAFIERISQKADSVLLGNLLATEAAKQHVVFSQPSKIILPIDGFPSFQEAFDIGEKTVALFQEKIRGAKSVFWTGPLGEVEDAQYARGSLQIAQTIMKSKALSVAGGGDLSSFLHNHGLSEKFSYVSTGGGATLAFLAGEKLPGLEVLGYYG